MSVKVKGHLVEVISLYHLGPKDQTQVIGLRENHIDLLSHHAKLLKITLIFELNFVKLCLVGWWSMHRGNGARNTNTCLWISTTRSAESIPRAANSRFCETLSQRLRGKVVEDTERFWLPHERTQTSMPARTRGRIPHTR